MQILAIVAAVGALQGVVLLLSILFKYNHRKNLPLALLLIVFSLRLATIPTWKENILLSFPWVYPLTAPLPFLFGPFLWWYIRELANDRITVPKYIFIHFLPYILEVAALVYTLASMSAGEYSLFLQNVFSGNPPLWLPVRNGMKVLLNILYIAFSWKHAFGKKSRRLSRAKRVWIRALLLLPSMVLAAFAYVAIIPSVTGALSGGYAAPFFILSVTMVLLIYTISFLLLIAPEVSIPDVAAVNTGGEQLCSDVESKYLTEKVEKRFREGAFRNPDLLLSDLASEFGVHPNRLSFAVNHCSGKSFKALLNDRRLRDFCRKVKEGALSHQSILDLAFEAGFPSKSTFNRVFRENTGMSPSEYLKKTDIA